MTRDADRLLARLALLVGAWVVYSSLQPFDFDLAPYAARLATGLRVLEVEHALGHSLGLGALGAFLGCLVRRAWPGAGLLVLACVGLEALQAATASRHLRAGDILLDVAVSSAAFFSARSLDSRLEIRARLESSVPAASRALVVLLSVFALLLVGSHERNVSLTGWDPEHSILLGDEATRDRPWRGTLAGLAFYRRALDAETSRELAGLPFDPGEGTRIRLARGAACVLPSASGWSAGSGDAAPALALDPPDPGALHTSSLRLGPGRAVIAEDRAAELALATALRAGASFSIELLCATDDVAQVGPARLVTHSLDPLHRNVTIGQAGDLLRLRVRTPLNGENGTRVEGAWPDVFVDREPHHLVASYHRGRLSLVRDGAPVAPDFHIAWTPPTQGWNPFGFPLIAAVLTFLPIGLLASLAWRSSGGLRRSLVAGLLAGGLTGTVLLVASSRYDTVFDPAAPLLAVLFVTLGDLAGRPRRAS